MRIILAALFILVLFLLSLKLFCFTPNIPKGISEIRTIRIGGINQVIMIRGEDIHNPVLLYLHGGPGSTELIPFRLFHRGLEKYFTIVSWEQRGCGKSYSPLIPKESMNVDQFISDTRELTKYLRKDLGKEKILLVGNSWGSALGLLTVQKYPELYYAFVGSGQEVRPSEGERIGYDYALSHAGENRMAVKELNEINSPIPYLEMDSSGKWFEKIKTQRKWLVALGGEVFGRSDYSMLFGTSTFLAPEYSWVDFIRFGLGSIFSLKKIWPSMMKFDFESQVPRINVPVFFFQGKHDFNAPTILVERYFTSLEAPKKELVIFENSGHHPMYEEAERYDRELVTRLLPLCK